MADTDTVIHRRRASDKGWRVLVRENWYRDVWLLLVTAIVLWALLSARNATDVSQREVLARAAQVQRESLARAAQFCHLINSTHADRVARYRQTVKYLHSPAGKEPTLLNQYIRKVSLPQTIDEIAQEAKAIPPICRK